MKLASGKAPANAPQLRVGFEKIGQRLCLAVNNHLRRSLGVCAHPQLNEKEPASEVEGEGKKAFQNRFQLTSAYGFCSSTLKSGLPAAASWATVLFEPI